MSCGLMARGTVRSCGLLMPERLCGLLGLAPSGRGTVSRARSRCPTPDCGATVLPDATLLPSNRPYVRTCRSSAKRPYASAAICSANIAVG